MRTNLFENVDPLPLCMCAGPDDDITRQMVTRQQLCKVRKCLVSPPFSPLPELPSSFPFIAPSFSPSLPPSPFMLRNITTDNLSSCFCPPLTRISYVVVTLPSGSGSTSTWTSLRLHLRGNGWRGKWDSMGWRRG